MIKIVGSDRLPIGHLKAFGSGQSILPLKEFHGQYPTISQFFNEFIHKAEGFLARKVLNDDIRFDSWSTDRKLQEQLKQFDDFDVFIQTVREPDRLPMNFKEFIQRYQRENIFLVDKLPVVLRRNIVIPRPLQCPTVLPTIENVILVMNRMSTSPLLFNREYHHLFCLYRGYKQLVLVDGKQYPDLLQLMDHGKLNQINPDRVDFKQFPAFSNVDYYHANLTAGDCLFIPKDWVFQERSIESSVVVIFNLFNKRASRIQSFDIEQCSKINTEDPATMTLDYIDWTTKDHEPNSLKQIMVKIVNSTSNNYDQWQKTFSKHLSFEIATDPETLSIFDEFYGIVDVDGDGQITINEIEQIDGTHQQHISEILYELVKTIDGREIVPSINDHVQSQNYKTDL